MKYQPLKYSDKELLEIFPEAKEIIPEKIKEWEEILENEKNELKDSLVSIYSQKLDEFSIWFGEQVARLFLMPFIMEADRNILSLKRMLSIFKPSGKRLEHWQEKVERARHYPIEELARSKLEIRQTGRNFFSLCPFHNEKHASFYIYAETNTFCCFGCQEKGDVIKLTMYLYGISFKEAVQMLQN
jgi:hypothetical protein